MRPITNVLRALITVFMLITGLGLYFYPLSSSYALVILGRSERCGFADIRRSFETLTWQQRFADTQGAAVKVVQQDSDLQKVDTPDGVFWAPRRTVHSIPQVLAEQEADIYGSRNTGVQPGDVVIDCGAHIGMFTRRALQYGARRVVAVEISPDNLECLRRNFASEIADGRVTVYPKGVWDREDFLTLRINQGTSLVDTVVPGDQNTMPGPLVTLTTIDNLVSELGLERVDFIKIDVEGAEEKALLGARNTLARFKPKLAVATENYTDQVQRIPDAVAQASSDYFLRCGYCIDHGTYIHPHVMYFNFDASTGVPGTSSLHHRLRPVVPLSP